MNQFMKLKTEEKKELVKQLFLSVESDHEWRELLDGVIEQLKMSHECTNDRACEFAINKLENVKLIINGSK